MSMCLSKVDDATASLMAKALDFIEDNLKQAITSSIQPTFDTMSIVTAQSIPTPLYSLLMWRQPF